MVDDLSKIELENMRLKSAVKELSILNEISSIINSTMPVKEISRWIIKKVASALNASEAAVHIFSNHNEQLSPRTFVRDKFDSSILSKSRLDINIVGWMAKHKRPLLINDISKDERFCMVDFGDNPLKSLLSVPLSAKGKLIGALTVFNSLDPNGFNADNIRLLSIIGTQSAQIMENARLYQEELRLKQIEGEIQAAKKIQEGFLPRETPQIEGFDIFGGTSIAKEIGGDFYDFIMIDDGRLFFSIGDVSGKGIPAALLMSTIQGQVRLLINREEELLPKIILSELNSIIYQLSGSAQFATMIIGYLNTKDSKLTICNGGHCLPIIVSPDGKIKEITDSCLLVGVSDLAQYDQVELMLGPNDILLLASDGIDEAQNETGDFFGWDRFKDVLVKYRHSTALEIYQNVLSAVAGFRKGAEQSDDLTLLVIKNMS